MKDVGFCWKLSPGDPLIGEFGEPSMEEREPRDPCPSSLSYHRFHVIGLSLGFRKVAKSKSQMPQLLEREMKNGSSTMETDFNTFL